MIKNTLAMIFLGFSSGLPLLLIFSSLSLWLRESGIQRSSVTFFAWAALGYSFKFLWAPVVDQSALPVLTKLLGRRRSWMVASQLLIICAISCMAFTDPAARGNSLLIMALASVVLGFSAATQDIVIDAYRIEAVSSDLQAMLSSAYITGYRVGMIVAGAGALVIAEMLGSSKEIYSYLAWKHTYLVMAFMMTIGISTALLIKEPQIPCIKKHSFESRNYFGAIGVFVTVITGFIIGWNLLGLPINQLHEFLDGIFSNPVLVQSIDKLIRFMGGISTAFGLSWLLMRTNLIDQNMLKESYLSPIKDFFTRYGMKTALILLALVGFYRLSDIVLGVIANVFYQDLGFTKTQIAGASKTFGLVMTITGSFLGGILSIRYKVMKVLFAGALLSALTNLLFMAQVYLGANIIFLYIIISADNLAAGLAGAAFVAFLSSLTSVKFTAVQYAIFSSLMTLFPKILGGWSGTMVDAMGYSRFFLLTAIMGVPVVILVVLAGHQLSKDRHP